MDPTGDIGEWLVGTTETAVAEVSTNGLLAKEWKANARLIAAAPGLLDGLNHVQHCDRCQAYGWEACPGGRAALDAMEQAQPAEPVKALQNKVSEKA